MDSDGLRGLRKNEGDDTSRNDDTPAGAATLALQRRLPSAAASPALIGRCPDKLPLAFVAGPPTDAQASPRLGLAHRPSPAHTTQIQRPPSLSKSGMSADAPEDESLVTLADVIAAEDEEAAEATAVLGASDSERCSFPLGYVARQALYACLTCRKDDTDAGVCLACSLRCHASHDLVELYTKRRFRCDCGNDKLQSACQLIPEKEAENSQNAYNQNFRGLYCTCAVAYPEAEGAVEDSMCQCCVCEDWLHSRHLSESGAVVTVDWAEMVCGACLAKTPRLAAYDDGRRGDLRPQKADDGAVQCRVPEKTTEVATPPKSARMKSETWREELCTCTDCEAAYKAAGLDFLRDPEDPVAAYERRGAATAQSPAQELAAAMGETMDPSTQRDMIHGFNKMKEGLTEYLGSFPPGSVIKKDDIDSFFEGLRAKKQRLA